MLRVESITVEQKMRIFENVICDILEKKGGIASVDDFCRALVDFEDTYGSRLSFRGGIRDFLQRRSIEFEKCIGIDLFSRLDGKDGYWTYSSNRYIKGLYVDIKEFLGKDRSAQICRECLYKS